MGISSQDKCSWQTECLSFNIVVFLLEQIASFARRSISRTINEGAVQQQQPDRRLKVGIDANLVGYKYAHHKSSFDPAGAVAHIAKAFAARHIDVVIFCDHPTERHPSKRASCKRQADKERQNIELLVARTQLQSLLSIQSDSADHTTIHSLQKRIRKLENSLKRRLPSNFSEKLQEFAAGYDSEGRGEILIKIAPTQADPCLAQLAVAGEIDAIISGDSDFCVYVGPSGPGDLADIMLKDLALTICNEPIKGCKVCTGQKGVADRIEAILSPKLGHSPFDKTLNGRVPQYPIFSGVSDPMVHALLAMLVGCDACPGGVKNMGPKAALELLKKHNTLSGTELHSALAQAISTMSGAVVKDKDAVLCLAKSILYEKTDSGYVHGPPNNLVPAEVKRRTGFRDLKHLLSYMAIVYAGELHDMSKTVSKMTWLEEIVLCREVMWGRMHSRLDDYGKAYGISYRVLKNVLRHRVRKDLDCRVRWPMYASYEEDAKLRETSWNDHFDPKNGHRPVMHDTTNIPLPTPSCGDLNRALYNKYYGMCYAKAGIAVQLCCWIFGLPLVTGHSDDDQQMEQTRILELQEEFSKKDESSIIAFLNIFDKGYHQFLEAMKHGQLCFRPDEANDQFAGDKVLRTGCVAVVRSGNERGVKRCKMSWLIKRGCSSDHQYDIDFLCDMWEAFTFSVNFMYDKFQ